MKSTMKRWRRRAFAPLSILSGAVLAAGLLLTGSPAEATLGNISTVASDWPFPPGAQFDDELRRVIPEGLRNAANPSDLINLGQPTLDSVTGGSTNPKMHNGIIMEDGGINVDNGANVTIGSTTTFHLNTALHPQGYDITRMWLMFGNKITGDLRYYEIAYSQVGDPTFTPEVFHIEGQPNNTFSLAHWGTDEWVDGNYVSPSFDFVPTGLPFWTNVDAIRFSWLEPAGTFSTYSPKVWEIDIEGAPSAPVPEPSSFVLAGLALAGLAFFVSLSRRFVQEPFSAGAVSVLE